MPGPGGTQARSGGMFPACFAFSVHKSGSTMLYNMVRDACAEAGLPEISIPDRFFREGIRDHVWSQDHRWLAELRDGRIYHGFRQLPAALLAPEVKLRERKSVLLVRDPRDALVSQHYSFGGRSKSHPLPASAPEAIAQRMKANERSDINEYVLSAASTHLAKLAAYRDSLLSPNLRVFRYEEIFDTRADFLDGVFLHFGVPLPEAVVHRVAARHEIRPPTENPSYHIRQALPGDHRRKLSPATIRELTEIFHVVSLSFGYELKAASEAI